MNAAQTKNNNHMEPVARCLDNCVVGDEDEIYGVIMTKDDPLRMKLTPEEHKWAISIKRSVEMNPELDNLSDFTYAQLALICQGDVEDAIYRAFGLQDFRQEYDVLDTFEDALRGVNGYLQQAPEAALDYRFSEGSGTYVLSSDLAQLDCGALKSTVKYKKFIAGAYYLHHAMAPDLETVRKGVVRVIDCGGVKWTSWQTGGKILVQKFHHLLAVYPCQNIMKHYNTGLMVNLLLSRMKRVLPARITDNLESGLTMDCPLREYWLVPTPESAKQRLLGSIQESLERRYWNEQAFSL